MRRARWATRRAGTAGPSAGPWRPPTPPPPPPRGALPRAGAAPTAAPRRPGALGGVLGGARPGGAPAGGVPPPGAPRLERPARSKSGRRTLLPQRPVTTFHVTGLMRTAPSVHRWGVWGGRCLWG